MKILVSTCHPFHIVRLELSANSLEHIFVGCPISALTGPESDFDLLRTLIERSVTEPCSAELVLYIEDDCPKKWIVSFALQLESNGLVLCQLDLRISDSMNNEQGAFASSKTLLDDLIVSDDSKTNKCTDNITFASVVSSSPIVSAQATHIPKIPSNAHSQGLFIVPRPRTSPTRERTPPASSPSPVVITTAVIDSLRGLPLPHAARSVGVSVTAFKRACRRLGVRRWQYTRGPGRAAGGAASSPAAREGGARRGPDSALSEHAHITPCPDSPFAVHSSASPKGQVSAAAGPCVADHGLGCAGRACAETWADWAEDADREGGGGWGDAAEDSDDSLVLLLLLSQPWR